jgi:predicted RNase H-like HicB family nuclease
MTPEQRTTPMHSFSVGLEEGADGAFRVHPLSLAGCVAEGATRDEALERYFAELSEWLGFLAAAGEPVPPADAELEIRIDEWIQTDAQVAEGESTACFEADAVPLAAHEVDVALRQLGELRGRILASVRPLGEDEADRVRAGGWSVRRTLDELARAQWWTLSRLGATPMAEVPERTLARLDTALALVIQHFTPTPPAAQRIEIDGESWTPRKVLRRLLWLEWTFGGLVAGLLHTDRAGAA